MADNLQITNPTGGMDKDSDYNYVDQNDYTDAINIRHITRDGNTTGDAETVYGNEFAWDSYVSGTNLVAAQNKYVRISIDATSNVNVDVTFYTSQNGVAISTGTTFAVLAGNIDQSITNCVFQMDADLTAGGYGLVTELSRDLVDTNTGSVVVEIGAGGTYTGIDWIIAFSDAAVTQSEVVQEAIPITYTGENIAIGSTDLLGNLFTFWTTRTTLPETRKVVGASNATPIVIIENEAHGLQDGDEVIIQGVPTNTNANGKWIVDVDPVLSNVYTLVGSAGNGTAESTISTITAQVGTGYCFITTSGAHGLVVGNEVYIVGVGGTTTANGLHNVVAVFSSTEFVIDVAAVGAYTSGGTAFRVSGAIHDANGYGEIWHAEKDNTDDTWDAVRLLGSVQFGFSTLKQIDCVAEINSGRTEIYFTDDYNFPRVFYYTGAYTEDGALNINGAGPNIYTYNDLDAQLNLFQYAPDVTIDLSQLQSGGSLESGNWRYLLRFSADDVNYTTFTQPSGLINVFSSDIGLPTGIRGDAPLTNTPKVNVIEASGIPTFFEYAELVGVHYVDGGVEVFSIKRNALDGSGSVTFYHYGSETTITNLDTAEIFEQRPDIQTALNILALDQRLLLANTTSMEDPDLTDWATAISYTVERAILDTTPTVGYGGEPVFGEYQNPENVENRVGYMINETYRFGIRLKYRDTDTWTAPYYIADITMNTANGLTDLSITDLSTPVNPPTLATSPNPYVIYPQFGSPDYGFVLPNGKTVREEFDKIEFVRVERNDNNKTILATGLAMLALDDGAGTFSTDPACLTQAAASAIYLTPSATYTGTSTERRLLYCMFPDTLLGGIDLELQSGDQVINVGNPTYQFLKKVALSGAGTRFDAVAAELYGDSVATDGTAEVVGVDALVYNAGTSIFSLSGNDYDPASNSAFNYASYYIAVDTELTDVNGVADYGIYYIQYYRPRANQYGGIETTRYITTGIIEDISTDTSFLPVYNVYGGDVFTQKATFMQTYTASAARYGQAVGFYAQNAVNSQMRQMGDDGSNEVALPRGNDPDDDWDVRINETGDYRNRELRAYDRGYNAQFLLGNEKGFDSNDTQIIDFPTRMWYSEVKPANSLLDNYRVFLPLQYKDLATSNGEILSLKGVNGELYTLQPRAFMRQFYNARATIEGGEDTSTIILGSTTVFSQDGRVISTRGTKHKWSVVKGRSSSGYDTLYWINSELKNAMKFDAGGTATVSEIKKMKSFFANNLTWADLVFTPADNFGIHGVWSERYGEVLWTIRANAVSSLPAWDVAASGGYSFGTAVTYSSGTPLSQRNFEQTGEIYTYKNVSAGNSAAPTDDTVWEHVAHTDPSYYNEYTVSYSELKDKWESFRSHKPTIYFQYKDLILSTRPLSNRGFVYEHDREFVCRWYEYVGEFQLTGSSITKDADTYTVVGVGTAFTTELQVGWEILDNSSPVASRYVIRSIESDTELTIDDYYILNYGLPSQETVGDAFTSAITFTRIYYPTQIEDAHLTPVVNLQAVISKIFEAQQYLIDEPPYRVDYTTPDHISYLDEDEFEQRNGLFVAPVKNDSTSNGLNSGDTSRLYGKWMLNKVAMRYLLYNKLFNFTTKVRYLHRMFNR
jgi:hypothetical protein